MQTVGDVSAQTPHFSFLRRRFERLAGARGVHAWLIDEANRRGYLGAFNADRPDAEATAQLGDEELVVGLLMPHAEADARTWKLVVRMLQAGRLDLRRLAQLARQERAEAMLHWLVQLVPAQEQTPAIAELRRRPAPRGFSGVRVAYDAGRLLRRPASKGELQAPSTHLSRKEARRRSVVGRGTPREVVKMKGKKSPPQGANAAAVEAGYRRLERSKGGSHWFWEVKVGPETGQRLPMLASFPQTIRTGEIGSPGAQQVMLFESSAEAKADTKKLVAARLREGYREVDRRAPAAPSEDAVKLEAVIEKNLDEPRGYLAYADWLQSRGDPLAELIGLQHRAATKPKQARELNRAASALIKKNAAHFFGPLARMYGVRGKHGGTLQVEWRFGFMRAVKIGWGQFEYDHPGQDAEDELKALLDLPVARFIEALQLGPVPDREQMTLQPLVDALVAKRKPACLRALELGDLGDWDYSSTSTGLFDPLVDVFPGLQKLTLRAGDIGLRHPLALPELRELAIQTGSLKKKQLEHLCALKCPKLERLELWFGDPSYGASGEVEDIAPILAGVGLKKVRHLGLMNCPFADDVAKALPTSKILKQLSSLDLSMGALSDAGVDAMAAARRSFEHLEHLNLDDNALTPASEPRLKGLAKQVTWMVQDPDRVSGRRYVSVGE